MITPEKLVVDTPVDITGVWNMQLDFRGYTNSEGVFTERLESEQWTIDLSQFGNAVSGTLLDVTSNHNNSCRKANMGGSVTDNHLDLTVRFTGNSLLDCCSKESVRIAGTLNSNGRSFDGTYEPVQVPSNNCTLSSGTVTGRKQ